MTGLAAVGPAWKERAVSVYSTGVDAYRDTTKWLTALVPVTAIATAALVAGPGVLDSIAVAPSAVDWLAANRDLLVCTALIVIAIGAIVWRAAVVLSVVPIDLGDIAKDPTIDTALTEALGAGMALPYFWDRNSFDAVMGDLNAALATNPIGVKTSDDMRLFRLSAALPVVREWSVHHRTRRPFQIFLAVFVAGVCVTAAGLGFAASQLGARTAITAPTPVLVSVDDAGAADLLADTGCSDPRATTFVAMGSWQRPRLAVDGPACRFGAVWLPTPSMIELRPAPK